MPPVAHRSNSWLGLTATSPLLQTKLFVAKAQHLAVP